MSNAPPIRILNVTDREVPRYVTDELLRREGFEVRSVATGRAALAAARDGIALAIVDVRLPDIDGHALCRQLKREEATAGVLVLLTSATFVTSEHKVIGLDAGADAYLTPPFEGAELVATIRALLRARAGVLARAGRELPDRAPPPIDPRGALFGPRESTPARACAGLHLAVIEDNDDAREALADVLTSKGHRVETAADGQAGLALVLASKPDVVLLDIGLPLCDGYQVAREIRATLLGADGPRLIAMTGYGQPDDRQRAFDAGFDVHLVKPLSMPQLYAVLQELTPPR